MTHITGKHLLNVNSNKAVERTDTQITLQRHARRNARKRGIGMGERRMNKREREITVREKLHSLFRYFTIYFYFLNLLSLLLSITTTTTITVIL